MRTMFTMGFQRTGLWGGRPRVMLGQASSGMLTDDDRNSLITDITNAIAAYKTLVPVMARTDLASFMGSDFADFQAASQEARKDESEMEALQARWTSDNQENYYWLDDERADFLLWKTAIAKMSALLVAAQQRATTAPISTTTPAVTTTAPPRQPRSAPGQKPAQTATPAKAAEPTILGLPQTTFLGVVGVGVVLAGLGYLALR